MSRLLKLASLPKLGEVSRERLKRGVFLLVGCGVVLAGVKFLAAKKIVSSNSLPVSQEELVNLGGKVLDKALSVLGRGTQKEREGEETKEVSKNEGDKSSSGTSGKIAGAVQEVTNQTQVVIEKTVEKKVEEIIETIKNLPEEQAKKVKKEVMKEICEEVCRVE